MATRTEVLVHKIAVENREALRDIDQYTGRVRTAKDEIDRHGSGISSSFRSAAESVNIFRVALTAAVGGIALAQLNRFAEAANRVTNLSRAFGTLTTRIGEASDVMLREARQATQGLVSDIELMQRVNQAVLLQVPLTAESFGELAEASVKLGRAMGIDAAFALESLITGIGRQSKLFLDNLGIVIDVDAAYRRYADSLGKTTDELTDLDRKMAFYEATLERIRDATAGLSDQTFTLGEAWVVAKTNLENFKTSVLDFLNRLPELIVAPFVQEPPPIAGFAAGVQAATAALPPGRFIEQPRALLGVPSLPPGEIPESALAPLAHLDIFPERAAAATEALEDWLAVHMPLIDAQKQLSEQLELQTLRLEAWHEHMSGNIEASREMMAATEELAVATELASVKWDVMRDALEATAGALLFMTQTGEFSAKTLVNAIARQVFGTLSALAIENTIRGFQELALAAAAAARYDPYAASLHTAASKLHFATAAKAGAGAGAALGVAGLTAGGGGGGGRGGGRAITGGDLTPPPQQTQVTVFIEGQGFVQNFEDFARQLGSEIERQMRTSGRS